MTILNPTRRCDQVVRSHTIDRPDHLAACLTVFRSVNKDFPASLYPITKIRFLELSMKITAIGQNVNSSCSPKNIIIFAK